MRMVNERTLAPMLAPFLEQVSHLVPTGTYVAPADETAVRAPAGGQSSPVCMEGSGLCVPKLSCVACGT